MSAICSASSSCSGVDYDDRGAITDDAIDVIRAAFTDEYPDVTTPRFGHIHDAGLAPRPRQRAIPIWVGGSSKAALRRAAERGDGWLPQGTPRAEMPASIAYLLEHRKQTIGDVPIDLGVIAETIYVGEPGVGRRRRARSPAIPSLVAERLNEFGAMGVSHVQVRFRSRDLAGAPRPDGRLRRRRAPAPPPLTRLRYEPRSSGGRGRRDFATGRRR